MLSSFSNALIDKHTVKKILTTFVGMYTIELDRTCHVEED
jgi:hypothetical protein